MRNQERIPVNELNRNANGGTELITRRLYDLLDPQDLDKIQIITSRVRELEPDKIRIYHLHDLPEDPEASHLKDAASRDRFDRLVFVSNWQYQQYQSVLGVPLSQQSCVIENGVDPIPFVAKADPQTSPIKLIYTSTPHRGLEILVPVFEALAEVYKNIELHVYSSFEIYGWPERDAPYQALFERCRQHPQIHYHGFQPQDVVRKAYQEAHIFAYPSIWPETSCRCLIEAMMAGCICVHPNYAALPDTAGGLTDWYQMDLDRTVHAQTFYVKLAQIIHALQNTPVWQSDGLTHRRGLTHAVATMRFGWPNVIRQWQSLVEELKTLA